MSNTNKRAQLSPGCLIAVGLLILFNFVVAYLIASGTLEAWLGR